MKFKLAFVLLLTLFDYMTKAQSIDIPQNSDKIVGCYPFQTNQNQSCQANLTSYIVLLTSKWQTVQPIYSSCISENDTIQINFNDTIKYLSQEFINFDLNFNETYYDFLIVSLDFIKFRLWSTESAYLQVDNKTMFDLYNNSNQGNPDKYCTNQNIVGNSTKSSFSALIVPTKLNKTSISIGSKANTPEREWSISNLLFELYKCQKGLFFNKTSRICSNCPDNCELCPNSNSCSKCLNNFNLFNQTSCLEKCPDTYFSTQGQCKQCNQICKTCDSSSSCLSCQDIGFQNHCQRPNNSTCKCDELTQLGKCLQQNPNCKNYQSQEGEICDSSCSCQECNDGYYLQDKQCVLNCQYYYILDQKKCTSTCPNNYFLDSDNKNCKNCTQQQLSKKCSCGFLSVKLQGIKDSVLCVSSNSQDTDIYQKCTQMNFQFLQVSQNNYQCLNKCPSLIDDQTKDPKKPVKYCKDCVVKYCINCVNQQCQKCLAGYTYIDIKNECQQNCSDTIQTNCFCLDGYYLNNLKQCLKCSDQYCQTCTDNTQCQVCKQNYYLINEKNCVTEQDCNVYGYTYGGKCLQCQDSYHCKTCTDKNNCTSCKEGFYLFNNTCYDKCPDGYYIDLTNQICVKNCTYGHDETKCIKCTKLNCNQCSVKNGEETCSQCNSSYYLNQQNDCTQQCPDQTFKDQKLNICSPCINNTCQSCKDQTNCLSCPYNKFLIKSNNITQCDTCENGLYYDQDNQKCVPVCSKGIGVLNNQNQLICVPCQDTNCFQCTLAQSNNSGQQGNNSQICLNCQQKSLYQGTCIDCPSQTYLDTNTNSCQLCSNQCKTCSSQYKCSSCLDGLFLYQDTCVPQCPSGFYQDKDQNKCSQCPQDNCKICDKNQCYQCQDNFAQISSQSACIPCPSEQYFLDKSCKQCVQSSYLNLKTQQCVTLDQCTNEYYIEGNICKPCKYQQDCKAQTSLSQKQNCKMQNQKMCISCADGFQLSDNGFCEPCPQGCKICQKNQCTSCIDRYCLVNSQCYLISGSDGEHTVSTCDDFQTTCTQYNKPDYGICLRCIKGPQLCSMCDQNSYLYNSECKLKCPPDLVADKNIYLEKFIYSGVCRNSCQEGYKKGPDEKCFYCPFYCTNCSPLEDQTLAIQLGQNYNCNSCNQDDNNTPYYLLQIYQTGQIKVNNCVKNCPLGYFIDNQSQCLQCGEFCNKCSDVQTCTKCQLGYFLDYNNKCVITCQTGYYQDISQNKCIKCSDDDCAKCSQAGYCQQCTKKYLVDGKCQNDCPPYQYKSEVDQTCQKCLPYCLKCSDTKSCEKCQQDTYLQKDQNGTFSCQINCLQGYYPEISTQNCQACDINNCMKCSKKNQCDLCNNNYFLQLIQDQNNQQNYSCVSTCKSGYYQNQQNRQCIQCQSNCTSCPDGVCKSCIQGFFLNINVNQCIKCIDNCEVCENSSSCKNCQNDYYYNEVSNYCDSKCPDGYFGKASICKKCSFNCKTCIDENQCQICNENYYLTSDSQQCVDKCQQGYSQVGNQCIKCIDNCEVCENSSSCKNCQNDYYYNEVSNSCDSKCPDGYFGKASICKKCSSNCKTCVDENQCQICNEDYYLTSDSQQCVQQCQQGYSQVGNQCIKCIDNCEECENSSSCKNCQNDYYYNEVSNSCDSKCPDGYFGKASICKKCSFNCKTCVDENQCQICNENYYLTSDSQQCIDKCQQGYSQVGNQCIKCIDNCEECENSSSCKNCQNDYYYNEVSNSCDSKCPDGYFGKASICKKCGSNCKTCVDENQCQICNEDYYLTSDSQQCVQQCQQGYSQVGSQCIKCADNCLNCFKANECNKCQSSFYLESLNKCSPCNSNCIECQDFNNCDKCKLDYFLINDKQTCEMSCPIGYFQQIGKSECSKCIDQCKICDSQNECKGCNDGYFLQSDNLQCVAKCPENYSQKDSQCIKCLSNCSECDTDHDCKKCKQGFYLNINKTCQECPVSNCYSCQTNSQSCDICQFNYVFDLQSNQCLQKCPENSFVFQDSNNNGYFCQECNQNCQKCSNSSECLQCKPSFYVDKLKNNTCSQCIENCANCNTDRNSCDQCYQDYYFISKLNRCSKQCPLGYFSAIDTNGRMICQQCISNCDLCQNSQQCQKCSSSYYLRSDTNQCIDKCPNGYSLNGSNCIKCVSNCQNCNDMNSCQQCRQGYYLSIDKQCISCQVNNCDVCQNTSNQCQVCALGFILSLDQSSCIQKCPEGQFAQLSNGNPVCSECSQNCNFCIDNTQCNQCKIGYTLINKKCVQCDVQQCNSCDSSVQICDQCSEQFYLSSNQLKCVSQCQTDEYLDKTLKMCKKCSLNCTKCQSDQICLECKSPFQLNDKNKCIQCDSSHYFDFQSKTCVFCDILNGNFIQNNVCKKCNYTCQTCSGISISECLTCPTNRFLYMNRCICQEGYIENFSQTCEKQQIDSKGLEGMQSGMTSLSAVSMLGGAGTVSSLRGMEVSQMVSFLTYVNVNYQGNSNQYLKILYSDNLSPIFPNVLQNLFEDKQNNTNKYSNQTSARVLSQEVYVDQYQQTDFKFMVNQKTNSFLFNISPLIILHLFVAFLLLTKFLVYKYTKLQYSKKKVVVWIKNNFRQTVFLLIFYLTYQELLLIVLLQLTKPFGEQAVSIVGSILTLLVSFYMVYLLYFIFKVVLFMPYLTIKEKNQKFGCIFYGLKDNRTAQIFILIKFIQKTVICMSIIYAYHSDQVLPQIVISGIVFLYELMIRPFYYKLVAFASFLLNALYLALLFLSYMIKSQQQNTSSIPNLNYSNSFEQILLAFIIVKNVIVLVDIIVLVYGFFKIIRGKRSLSTSTDDGLSNRTSTDLENTLSKSITWRNNPLMTNNFNSVKIGKQNMSEIQNEFRRTDSIYLQDSPPTRKDSSSPVLKKLSNFQRSSPPGQLDSSQILQNQILGKEILVVKWKKNKLFKNDMNDAL
ncbi:hypothetical protein ABPG73_017300 [Tetrahymena malaccensis]